MEYFRDIVCKPCRFQGSEQIILSIKASPVVVSLRQPYRDALARRAGQLRMGEAEAAAALLSLALEPYLDDGNADQAKAERELLKIAENLAREESEGNWSEHLTLSVFNRIEAEHLRLYERAAGAQYGQLNRRIGRRIKEAVGATVKLDEQDKPVVVHAPRSSRGLIRRYTLLTKA